MHNGWGQPERPKLVHLFAFDAFYQEGLSRTVLCSVPSYHFAQHVLQIKSSEIILITNWSISGHFQKYSVFVPPKFCISIVFILSWDLNLETMLMQKFGQTNRKYGGIFESGLVDRCTRAWLRVQQHSYLQSRNNNMPTLQTNIIIG